MAVFIEILTVTTPGAHLVTRFCSKFPASSALTALPGSSARAAHAIPMSCFTALFFSINGELSGNLAPLRLDKYEVRSRAALHEDLDDARASRQAALDRRTER